MRAAATVIQCMARRRQARLRVQRERKRRALGPEVVEMLRRGSRISGYTLTVVIYRCGGSYKIVGHDLVHGCQYTGFVYEPEMTKLLEWHNAQLEVDILLRPSHDLLDILCVCQGEAHAIVKANRVMPWQHLRAAEVLLNNLALTAPVTSLTRELSKGGKSSNFKISEKYLMTISIGPTGRKSELVFVVGKHRKGRGIEEQVR